jgi:MFS family permease
MNLEEPVEKGVGSTSIINDHESGESPPKFDAAPEGGVRAWFVVAGAASIAFSGLGILNSFGVFQEYYMRHQLQHESADRIAWIGSLTAFLQFTGSAISGPLFDRLGAWVSLLVSICSLFCSLLGSHSNILFSWQPRYCGRQPLYLFFLS